MIRREKVMEREGGNETLKQICLEDKPRKGLGQQISRESVRKN
jgi:hypothetical protein